MGVDASIFAVKARLCYYVDRVHNVDVFECLQDERYRQVISMLRNSALPKRLACGLASSEDVQYLCRANADYWASQVSEQGREYLNRQLVRFAALHPDDEFFIVTDHDGPSMHEVKDEGGYRYFQFPEDIPARDPNCTCDDGRALGCTVHPPPTPEEERRQLEEVALLTQALSCGYRGPNTFADGTTGGPLLVEPIDLSGITWHDGQTKPMRPKPRRRGKR